MRRKWDAVPTKLKPPVVHGSSCQHPRKGSIQPDIAQHGGSASEQEGPRERFLAQCSGSSKIPESKGKSIGNLRFHGNEQ